ncbi:hypothetical protein Pflav_060470 [Phytohabitans flavus]|uniref:Uncharacterized protein n=1 Tax=Phytohabitans flavus TaxID=1076124 RepID=A0A6F8Y0P6_9ACTN|nr:hypothetical protein Pflav_060470 [Phytohabitans flavus]
MGAGHAHVLHLDRDTPLHRLPPEVKIAAMVSATVVVVITPREALWAFAGYAVLVAILAAIGRVPPGWLAKRSLVEVPFVLLAVALPFIAAGEKVTFLGLELSRDGLYGGFNILAKGTLGVLLSLILAATTTTRDLIVGLDRLRCPQIITQIATFMLRYLAVLGGEARRMRIARISRGTTRASCGSCAASPPEWARSSCARSSGASGSTWRWWPADTRGGCPPPGSRSGRPPGASGWLPLPCRWRQQRSRGPR